MTSGLSRLSAREQRLVAVLLLLALVALVVRGLVLPIADGFAARAEARRLAEMEYARNQRLIAGAPRLARVAQRQNRELANFILTAPTPAAGADRLQERLQAAIEAAGGEFRGGEALTGQPDQIAVRIEARMTQAQLAAVLARAQNVPPYLAVDGLTIAADSALTSSVPGPLDVRFDVSIPFLAGA